MRGLVRALLVASTLVGTLAFTALVGPGRALACSCAVGGPDRIGTFADEPSIVVFIGTVTSMDRVADQTGNTRGELLIQRVFKGDVPSARMPVRGGGGGDCTMSLEAGERMITAASLVAGVITPGLCMPYGDPTTPEGERLIEAATRAYGAGVAPPGVPAEPTSSPAAPTGDARDLALPLVVGGAIAMAALLFGGLMFFSRRRSTGREP